MQGHNYLIGPNSATFFDCSAYKDRRNWVLSTPLNRDGVVVTSDKKAGMLENEIDAVKRAGKEGQVVYVLVSPAFALFLYIERVLTARDFGRAKEQRDYIELPGIRVKRRRYIVRIVKDMMDYYAVANKEGKHLMYHGLSEVPLDGS